MKTLVCVGGFVAHGSKPDLMARNASELHSHLVWRPIIAMSTQAANESSLFTYAKNEYRKRHAAAQNGYLIQAYAAVYLVAGDRLMVVRCWKS